MDSKKYQTITEETSETIQGTISELREGSSAGLHKMADKFEQIAEDLRKLRDKTTSGSGEERE